MIRAAAAFNWPRAMSLAIASLLFAGCASAPDARQAERGESESAIARHAQELRPAQRAAAVAVRQVGTPYRYGGQSPSGFDCSGLVHFAYASVGRNVPRTTTQLWSASRHVPREQLEAGDLLFFRFDGKMSHVGLYVGDGRFVHAPSSGKRVSVQRLDRGVYQTAFIRGGRL